VAVATPLHELAKLMFNSLTAIYTMLYGTLAPLTVDWYKAEVLEQPEYDAELVSVFRNMKMEIIAVCKSLPAFFKVKI